MVDTIKHGIQDTNNGGKLIEYGIRKPSSEFDRRPNAGDVPATIKFDKQKGAGPSGNSATQTKGAGKHKSIGGSSAYTTKGSHGK